MTSIHPRLQPFAVRDPFCHQRDELGGLAGVLLSDALKDDDFLANHPDQVFKPVGSADGQQTGQRVAGQNDALVGLGWGHEGDSAGAARHRQGGAL